MQLNIDRHHQISSYTQYAHVGSKINSEQLKIIQKNPATKVERPIFGQVNAIGFKSKGTLM